jgi:hypothetical protein
MGPEVGGAVSTSINDEEASPDIGDVLAFVKMSGVLGNTDPVGP